MKKGVVYWITGLSGSGKTTIGSALYYELRKKDKVIILDGDILKSIVSADLGYRIEDRKERAKRYSVLCKTLADQGIDVIICTIAMFDEIRNWNRENFEYYVEIFLDVPMEVLKARDKKGLYSSYSIQDDVSGFAQDTELPKNPDIVLYTDGRMAVKECVKKIIDIIPRAKKKHNNDTEYWNKYYSTIAQVDSFAPSQFAQEIFSTIIKKGGGRSSLLELGCGNGRDSVFFAKCGCDVTAIDASEVAILALSDKYQNATFICDDFVDAKVMYQKEYDYCYSRFTLHAINEEQESTMLKNVYGALKHNGMFFIETRTIHDSIYGKGEKVEEDAYIYEQHYRRFINPKKILDKVTSIGFSVVYAEESTGFSRTELSDPVLLRMILKK